MKSRGTLRDRRPQRSLSSGGKGRTRSEAQSEIDEPGVPPFRRQIAWLL